VAMGRCRGRQERRSRVGHDAVEPQCRASDAIRGDQAPV
jgi:hypothetical protein